QPRGGDRLAAAFAPAVPAFGQPPRRRLDLGQVLAGRAGQGGQVLALERDGGAFGVVLVVAPGRPRRLDDRPELPLQRGQPLQRGRPLRRQQRSRKQLRRIRLLRHPPCPPPACLPPACLPPACTRRYGLLSRVLTTYFEGADTA